MSGSSSNPTTIPRTATATSGVSLPSQTGSLKIPSRPMHPEQDMYQEEDPRLATSLMGTSLPITIPIRPDSPSRDGDALRKSSDDKFVPPHLLERVDDDENMSEVFSPSSMRREQLLRQSCRAHQTRIGNGGNLLLNALYTARATLAAFSP